MLDGRSAETRALYFPQRKSSRRTENHRENEASKHCRVILPGRGGRIRGLAFLCAGYRFDRNRRDASCVHDESREKAARKHARDKKNAELKKLEDAGYNPGRANDPNYPQDLQNAQKKAGIGAGASQ